MSNIEIRPSVEKNRLYIILDGFLSDDEIKAAAEQILSGAKKLKPGFDTLSDIRGFKPATPAGFEMFKNAASAIVAMEHRMVVRVDDHATVGSMQFKRLSAAAGYEPVTVPSLEDGELLLDRMK